MPIDIRAALADRRKSAQSALRMPVCLDRDLVDEFEAFAAQRTQIVAPFEMRRQEVARRSANADVRMGDDPSVTAGVIDAEQAAATADIDAKIAEAQKRGAEYTVDLIFAIISPGDYQAIVNKYLTGNEPDMAGFRAALTRTCFRGVQQDGQLINKSVAWEDFEQPPADDPEAPAALSFGEVDAIGMQVFYANRGTVAAPFSRKSSANNP